MKHFKELITENQTVKFKSVSSKELSKMSFSDLESEYMDLESMYRKGGDVNSTSYRADNHKIRSKMTEIKDLMNKNIQ